MTLQRSFSAMIVALCLSAAALAIVAHGEAPSTSRACRAATVTRLYLGQNTPAGIVTETQWRTFIAEAVVPRFPGGFTELQGEGQWRNARGTTAAERTRIIEVAHDDAAPVHARVRAIAADYRRRFDQESVLITRMRAQQCFEEASD
jgi:hypothetical protein